MERQYEFSTFRHHSFVQLLLSFVLPEPHGYNNKMEMIGKTKVEKSLMPISKTKIQRQSSPRVTGCSGRNFPPETRKRFRFPASATKGANHAFLEYQKKEHSSLMVEFCAARKIIYTSLHDSQNDLDGKFHRDFHQQCHGYMPYK